MTIQITKTETIEVPVPSFWKREYGFEFTALLSEDHAVNIYRSDTFTLVKSGAMHIMGRDVENAHRTLNLCTETEFMEAYNKTLKSLSLQPELI
jgi:hypothetical protein